MDKLRAFLKRLFGGILAEEKSSGMKNGRNEKDISVNTKTTDKGKFSGIENADKVDTTDKANISDKADTADKADTTGKPDTADIEGKTGKIKKAENTKNADTADKETTDDKGNGVRERQTCEEKGAIAVPDEPSPAAVSGKKNAAAAVPGVKPCYDNRELSWLKFNARVLEEAEDERNPFCERLPFASIFQTNLDEFFRVRVGSLYDQMLISEDIRDNKTNMTCREQLLAVFDQVKLLNKRKDAVYADLMKGVKKRGIEILSFAETDPQDQEFLETCFRHEILPLLSPQVVGNKQPFPFLNNRDIYAMAVLVKKGKEKLGIVPCSVPIFSRLVRIPQHENRYMLMEELILHFMSEIFDSYEISSKSLIRILRNADIDPDEEMYDDDADFRNIMEQLVHKRSRLSPIRLEYTRLMDPTVLNLLCNRLELKKRHVFRSKSPLDLSFFSVVQDILRNEKELFFDKFSPQMPDDLDRRKSMLEQVREKDRFLFYPYDSMEPFLQMLAEAADHPDVVSIKMTLYRVASNSKVVEALIRAAENGKEVDVLVELRARFDEANNIGWSRRLEEAGCHILYGLDNLKVHSKLCLITTRERGQVFYYTQIGTGNYNEKTARLYTDFSLMTAHQGIGAEANRVMTDLYLGQVVHDTTWLLVAPKCLRGPILEKIDRQIELARMGRPAYVGAKTNSLTDKVIMDKLIEASAAGVKVELLVRGACCLVAGVPGLTENITIRSIVGRYLEHSRIYIFGPENQEVYISSADFMTRNTTRRVEVAVPVMDPEIREQVLHIFRILMTDNVKARVQQADGRYVRVRTEGEPLSAQEYFQKRENRLGGV
ncbi:MAG: polyphosphate kinase 1 [Clostridiales bacterium]|nr:polyphosphate kinase 1 [Clostridiales bacterium]